MTDTATSAAVAPAQADLELGHPVRSFVVLLLFIGGVLLGIQASGAVHPQLRTSGASSGELDDGREYRAIELQNDGFAPLRVEAIDWPTLGWTDVELGVLSPDTRFDDPSPASVPAGMAPLEPFTLSGEFGQARWIVLIGQPTCPGRPISESVEIRVRTWAGVERSVSIAGPDAGAVADSDKSPAGRGCAPAVR